MFKKKMGVLFFTVSLMSICGCNNTNNNKASDLKINNDKIESQVTNYNSNLLEDDALNNQTNMIENDIVNYENNLIIGDTVNNSKTDTSTNNNSTGNSKTNTSTNDNSTNNGKTNTSTNDNLTSNSKINTSTNDNLTSNSKINTSTNDNSTNNGKTNTSTNDNSTSNSKINTLTNDNSTNNGKTNTSTNDNSTNNNKTNTSTNDNSTSNSKTDIATNNSATNNENNLSNNVPVINNTIDVSVETLNVEVGKSATFSIKYSPIDTTLAGCMILNSSIGTTQGNYEIPGTANYVFYAQNTGNTKIECSNMNGGLAYEVKKYINVNVYKNNVEGFRFTQKYDSRAYYDGVGGYIPGFYEFLPSNATNQEFELSSSNESVAIISNGHVVPVGLGTTTITAKTLEGGFTDSYELSNYELKLERIEMKNCKSLNQYLKVGSTHQLKYQLNPSEVTFKNIIWYDENDIFQNTSLNGKSVLSVDQNGLVTGLIPGSSYVYVKDSITGLKDRCHFIVEN